MAQFFRHPITLLIAGALITGLLVPRITRMWQDRQREMELRTQFVAEMSRAVMTIVMAVQAST